MWSFIGWNPCFALCIGTCRESSLSGINWYAIYHAEAVIEISEYDISPYAKQEFSQNESSLSGINWYAIYHAEAVIEISEYDISPYAKQEFSQNGISEAVIEISEYDISPYAKQEFSQNGIWKKRFYQSVPIHDGFRFSKGFKKNKLSGTCVMRRKG